MQKSSGWTPERKARQAALIRAWKPWQQSTGPKSPAGKAKASRNAFTGGHAVMLRQLAKELNAAMREQRGAGQKSRGPPDGHRSVSHAQKKSPL